MSPSRCNARQTAAFSPDSREGLPTGRYGRAESLPHLFRADCTAPSSKKRGNGSPPPAGIPISSVYVSYPELSSPAASRTCRCSRHIPTCATHHRECLGKRRAQPWGIRQTGTKGKRGMFAISRLERTTLRRKSARKAALTICETRLQPGDAPGNSGSMPRNAGGRIALAQLKGLPCLSTRYGITVIMVCLALPRPGL